MGGILAKATIASLLEANHTRGLKRVAGLVLLACPQLGSLRTPRWLHWCSRDARVLAPHNPLLRRIDRVFSARLHLERERSPLATSHVPTSAIMAAEDFWVDPLSAGIGIPAGQRVLVRGDHSEILHPRSREADPYRFLRESIDACLRPETGLDDHHEIRVCEASEADLEQLSELARYFFGTGISPTSTTAELLAHGGTIKVVKQVITTPNERRERISGYLSVIPLREGAADAVRRGDLLGPAITVAHLAKDGEHPRAVYIGGVAAYDYYSRGLVMGGLRDEVERREAEGVAEFFARPFTARGLALVERYGFRPVTSTAGLGALYLKRSNRDG